MRFKKIIFSITVIFATIASLQANAEANNEAYLSNTEAISKYDSLLTVWYANNIADSYEAFVKDFINIEIDSTLTSRDLLPDSVYMKRFDMMATAVQLPYNPIVKNYITTYTIRNRTQLARLMGLAQYYMPIFEKELDIQGLPEELKIIPIIESGLNPKAKSWVGAGGLWQFMLTVGKSYGLRIDSFVDERFDPIKSTKVACRFMKDLYKIYGDWTLVIAAYNCGPGNVNKAIRRAGGAKTYWDIYYYLPRETRNHIPAFIAATYAYTFHKAHGIEPIAPPFPIITDTVMVRNMTHFEQISTTIDVPIDVLRSLNPQYKLDIIPAKSSEMTLILPSDEVVSFVENEKEIYGKEKDYLAKFQSANKLSQKAIASHLTHKVRSGETLGGIALKYRTSAKTLMRLNGIKDARKLRVGATIRVR